MATQKKDETLVKAVLAGEPGAFEELHDSYRERIYRFALKRIGSPEEAEDVTQEVFLQIHRCLPSFEGRSSLLTWMFGIAHNQVCRSFRRKNPVRLSIDDTEVSELAAEQVPVDRQVEAARLLERCNEVVEQELSEGQREAFALRYGENQSTRSIAERMGKSTQAVKISLFRSRRVLAERMNDWEVALSA